MSAVDPRAAYRTAEAFFAELAAHGLANVVISPGSRSTPLAITAHQTRGLRSHVVLDERVAGFFALGLSRATGTPTALICTSGTAAANYLPAVVEAHYSRVPLIVCTADRPPELRDRGAGQTIDQVHLYGSHVRWFVDTPVASDVGADYASRLAARAVAESGGPYPGPVHCNWPLREPLSPDGWAPADPAAPRVPLIVPSEVTAANPEPLAAVAEGASRGLIVVGPGDLADRGPVIRALARHTGWPVLAEATSSLRAGTHVGEAPFLAHWDLLLRHERWADDSVPDLVVRFGGPPTSKPLRLWLERHRPPLVLVDPAGRLEEPSNLVTHVAHLDIETAVPPLAWGFDEAAAGEPAGGWTSRWVNADRRLATRLGEVIDDGPLLEAGIVRALGAALPADAALVVSNSMPVRDVDAYLPISDRPLRVIANRGASGIDGLTSTAFGVAASGATTVLLTGDVAFVHDIGGLHAGVRAGLDLTIVVPDNGGGGIFEFLPVAADPLVAFDELFLTPSRVDWPAIDAMRGVRLHEASTADQLEAAVRGAVSQPGVDVVRVPVDRRANVAQHAELAALVDELV